MLTSLCIFVFCTSLILFGSYRFTRAFLCSGSILDCAASFCATAVITIHLIIIAAGMNGQLTVPFVTIASIAISIAFFTAKQKPQVRKPISFSRISILMIISLTFVLACYVVSFTLLSVQSVKYPSLYYDALYFYLPSVVHWLKSASLEPWPQAPLEVRFFPCGSYLIYAWMMIFVKNDFLTGFIQPLLVITSTITLIAIGKQLRFPMIPWILCSAAFFISPVFTLFVIEDNNDFLIFYTFLAALYFLIRYHKQQTSWIIFLSGCSAGLCLGSKYAGLCWVIVCAIMYVLISINIRCALKQRLAHFGLWIAGILLCGGYWYMYNAVVTGNPFFPSLISVFGIPLYTLPDHIRGLVYNDSLNEFRTYVASFSLLQHLYRINDVGEFIKNVGLNYFLMGLVPVISIIIMVKNARYLLNDLKQGHQPAQFMILSVISGIIIITMPGLALYLQNLRYALPALALLLITTGFLLHNSTLRKMLTALAITHAIISVFVAVTVSPGKVFILSTLITVFIVVAITNGKASFHLILSYIQRIRIPLRAVTIITCIILIIPLLLYTKTITAKYRYSPKSGKYSNDEILRELWPSFSEGWQWIDNHTDGDVIGFCDRSYVYPLFNSRLTNHLINLDASSREMLYAILHNTKVDYIFFQEQFIYDTEIYKRVRSGQFAEERQWFEEIPVPSALVFQNESVAIYRILQDESD